MFEWLKEHLHEVEVNLGILIAKFGPKKHLGGVAPDTPKPEQPTPKPQTPAPVASPAPKIDSEADMEPVPDPALANEPEPERFDIEYPVSLQGTPFEQSLRRDSLVQSRLIHAQYAHVAMNAVNYLITGVAPADPRDKKTRVWSQVRGACLELIIDALDRYHQRATYGAVAGIVGGLAQSVMSGKPRGRRYSWIVSKATHLPTGYSTEEKHPALEERTLVLDTPNHLREWLMNPT